MRKFNCMMMGVLLFYVSMALLLYWWCGENQAEDFGRYKVEANQILRGFEADGIFSDPDLTDMEWVREVSFLAVEDMDQKEVIKEFYHARNGRSSFVQPLFAMDKLTGFVRFDYVAENGGSRWLWILEGILLLSCVFVLVVLLYVRNKILKPFHALSELPYELSKGHLHGELEESKSRFFGKFVWGIAMLRDSLSVSKARELKLEKDKKMLLLSLSHDIKIPLSTIQLYAKALREGLYNSQEKKLYAAAQIEVHALEIEQFVKEIITASSEDILAIAVDEGEFYLKDYMEKVQKDYTPKCRIAMTKLYIGSYENKLLKGDMERAFEVMENLIENALKYGDGREISIDFYEEEYCQIIRVYNTGTAVAQEEISHLFDSFYRGSNVEGREGNGLGLYIGREIMRKMEGELFAERVQNGMRFCMVFQRAV